LFRRLIERLENIDHPPGFEVIPLTPKEFIRLIEKKNPVALERSTQEYF